MLQPIERPTYTQEEPEAAVLYAAAEHSRWASKECARGAAAAALVAIASVVANVAAALVAALLLISVLLARRLGWLARARSEQESAEAAEVAASFAASNWRRRAHLRLVL